MFFVANTSTTLFAVIMDSSFTTLFTRFDFTTAFVSTPSTSNIIPCRKLLYTP
eukprot:IDg22747t1